MNNIYIFLQRKSLNIMPQDLFNLYQEKMGLKLQNSVFPKVKVLTDLKFCGITIALTYL